MQAKIASKGFTDRIVVRGGGTHAPHGYPATDEAQRVLADRGIDITGHRSHPTDQGLMQASDLILTATRTHARSLGFEFKDQAHKVHVLRQFGKAQAWQGIEDVDDPVGLGMEAYKVTADLLEEQIERIWPLVREAVEAMEVDPDGHGTSGPQGG